MKSHNRGNRSRLFRAISLVLALSVGFGISQYFSNSSPTTTPEIHTASITAPAKVASPPAIKTVATAKEQAPIAVEPGSFTLDHPEMR